MKKLLITLFAIGLMIGPIQAQMEGTHYGDGTGDGGFMQNPPPLEDIDPEVRAEILELFEAVKAIRADLRVSRAAVIEALGPDATREQKIAALAVWREENADTIAEMHTLSEELRTLIQENRPDRPVIDIPDDILANREELKERRQALAESRREAILALGEDPTDEAVREAIEAWRAENADELAAVHELAKSLRDWFRENRPHRADRVMTPRMLQRRLAFRENIREMHQNRLELREQMQNAETAEERHALMQAFRQQQRELMRDRKQLKREERLNQGGGSGDRRPGG